MARTTKKPAIETWHTTEGRRLLREFEALRDRLYEHEDRLSDDDLKELLGPAYRLSALPGNMLRSRQRGKQSAASLIKNWADDHLT